MPEEKPVTDPWLRGHLQYEELRSLIRDVVTMHESPEGGLGTFLSRTDELSHRALKVGRALGMQDLPEFPEMEE